MISDFEQIRELFKEVDTRINKKVDLFTIGGAVLLDQGIKPATKDIDIVVQTKEDFLTLNKALIDLKFITKIPGAEYKHMDLNQIFIRDDYRIDLFQREVCGRFSLSEGMTRRARLIAELNKINLYLCSNEDVFLFKTMTEREGDLEDCISLAKVGITWNSVIEELKHQIKHSKQDVWITWVGERLDLLEEKGLTIPIMNEMNKLRDKFFDDLERKQI